MSVQFWPVACPSATINGRDAVATNLVFVTQATYDKLGQ
eukprot:gene12300-10585_t